MAESKSFTTATGITVNSKRLQISSVKDASNLNFKLPMFHFENSSVNPYENMGLFLKRI